MKVPIEVLEKELKRLSNEFQKTDDLMNVHKELYEENLSRLYDIEDKIYEIKYVIEKIKA